MNANAGVRLHAPVSRTACPNCGHGPSDPEAAAMTAELAGPLRRRGQYNVTALARACAAMGRPHPRTTISKVLNGDRWPSMALVEDLARAAGVDVAFLYPERRVVA